MSEATPTNAEPTRTPAGAGRLFTALLVIAVLALAALVVMLNLELARTREQLVLAEQALARERTRDALAVGDEVGPLTLVRADGSTRTVDFRSGRSTLVFMVSAQCPYCEQTLPVWQRLMDRTEAAAGGPVAVVCVQSDARVPGDLKPIAPPLDPHMLEPGAATWVSRIPISPGVVLVGGDGVVKRTWFGVPSDRDEAELAAVLLGGEVKK